MINYSAFLRAYSSLTMQLDLIIIEVSKWGGWGVGDAYSLDPRHFWPCEGLGKNNAWKCLAGMPRILNPVNFVFRFSTRLVRYYFNFQISMLYYIIIYFLSLVELERWLADVAFFPSSTPMEPFQFPRHFPDCCCL